MLLDNSSSKFDYEKNETPEVRIAPEHKAINPDKLPKRPVVNMPQFWDMKNEQLLAIMVTSLFGMPFDKVQYKTNPSYKSEVDWNLHAGYLAMAMLFLRDNNVPIENVLKDSQERLDLMKKSFSRIVRL